MSICIALNILIMYLGDVMKILTELIADLIGALLLIGGFFALYYVIVPTF